MCGQYRQLQRHAYSYTNLYIVFVFSKLFRNCVPLNCLTEYCRDEVAIICFRTVIASLALTHQTLQDVPVNLWLMVWPCGKNSACTMSITSKKAINIILILDVDILAFFSLGDNGLFVEDSGASSLDRTQTSTTRHL